MTYACLYNSKKLSGHTELLTPKVLLYKQEITRGGRFVAFLVFKYTDPCNWKDDPVIAPTVPMNALIPCLRPAGTCSLRGAIGSGTLLLLLLSRSLSWSEAWSSGLEIFLVSLQAHLVHCNISFSWIYEFFGFFLSFFGFMSSFLTLQRRTHQGHAGLQGPLGLWCGANRQPWHRSSLPGAGGEDARIAWDCTIDGIIREQNCLCSIYGVVKEGWKAVSQPTRVWTCCNPAQNLDCSLDLDLKELLRSCEWYFMRFGQTSFTDSEALPLVSLGEDPRHEG